MNDRRDKKCDECGRKVGDWHKGTCSKNVPGQPVTGVSPDAAQDKLSGPDIINLPDRLRSVEEAGNVPRWLEDAAMQAADEIERLRSDLEEKENERTAAAIRALQGEAIATFLRPMFRWVHGRCYFDGHEFSVQHGLVLLNDVGRSHLSVIDDNPLWKSVS
jgi:hypothetical protein